MMSKSLTTMEENTEFTTRNRVDYDITEQMVMKNSKNIVLLEIDNKTLKGESIIYDNQEECSLAIVSNLHNKKLINIMVVALTQSGKTGAMSGLIKNYLNDTTNLIPIENIYIITGLSSCEWVKQTTNRMPKSIEERVFHRNNLTKKFVDDIKNKKNVLIIIDEIQIAAKENQTLYKAFSEAGFYNKQNLLKNDIKIIEFTATPDGTIYDLMNWGENALKIKMEPGDGYTSCFDLKNQGRVFQYKDLCGYDNKSNKIDEELVADNINELKSHIDKYEEPLYHIIRTPNGDKSKIVIRNFKKYINKDIKCYSYDKDSDIEDINKILKIEPEQHTFIFLKEKLRCAKTLDKTYLGIVYERYTKSPDDAVVIQGLIGRGTGYDDNGKSIYFTNIPSIEKYEKLWNSNFEDKTVNWKSKTTKRKNKLLHSTGTYNNPSLIDGMSVSSEESNEEHEPVIKKFKDFDLVKKYVKEELGNKRGPNNPSKNINQDGFYENYIRGKRSVMSTKDVYEERKWGIKQSYRFHSCYEDVNDTSTLQFWIIHY
tara:strand:- start:231 stop:1850 length:1620 start_codon:yes stop_codon:yes gene_type:complete